MGSHKYSTQVERLEVVETGRPGRWTDDEKLKIVLESMQTPRPISSTARRYGISRSLLLNWRRSFCTEPEGAAGQKSGFVPAMVVADPMSSPPATPTSGHMVIEIGKDRRVIAGVDTAALARVMNGLALLVQEGLGRDPFAGDVLRRIGATIISCFRHATGVDGSAEL